jgi:hypothetical protein
LYHATDRVSSGGELPDLQRKGEVCNYDQ